MGSKVEEGLRESQAGFARRFLSLAGGYWREERLKAWWLTGTLVVLTVFQVLIPIAINLWSQRLFDALEQRATDRFLVLIGALGGIILANMVVTTTHLRFRRRLQVGWRRWLTRRVLDAWMQRGRHYLVNYLPGEHDNPDGRIAEDVRITTEYAIDLAHSLFYCLLLLVSFTNILWQLSGPAEFTLFGIDFHIPGHLVWIALVYAFIGTTVAVALGRPLVNTVNRRQTREADFRFGLARVRESSEAIALIQGEADERRRFVDLFQMLKDAWDRQTSALVNIFLFTSSYSVLSTAFPILVAAPRYMSGSISLGVLMQTAQAFQQMEAALSWPIDNLAKGAEWKASVERVMGLHDSLSQLDREIAEANGNRIAVVTGDQPALAFRDVSVATPDGRVVISGFSAEIPLGEHVLIADDAGAAMILFKVVAGLWPWGRGRVELPSDGSIFFMPQQPYLPVGSLRAAISYPAPPFPDEAISGALASVGLGPLAARLDEVAAWDKTLTLNERQRASFARLLLHRPNWIFNQEATDSLGAAGEEELMPLFDQIFAQATVLTVGRGPRLEAYHKRKLILEKSAEGLILVKDRGPGGQRIQPAPWRLYKRLAAILRLRARKATGGLFFPRRRPEDQKGLRDQDEIDG